MSKVKLVDQETGEYWFYCPGCNMYHLFRTKGPVQWTFNGSLEKPTINPSHRVGGFNGETVCHSFIKDGNIQFLTDSKHSLSGQTVELPECEL